MYDLLQGGYVPICLIVMISAWFISKLKIEIAWRILLALSVPIGISLAWYIIPDLLRSHPYGHDPMSLAWCLMTVITLSVVAVPVSIISVIICIFIQKRSTSK